MYYYVKILRTINDFAEFNDYFYFNSKDAMEEFIANYDEIFCSKIVGFGKAEFNKKGALIPDDWD